MNPIWSVILSALAVASVSVCAAPGTPLTGNRCLAPSAVDELLKKPHEVNGSDDLKAQLANAGDKLVVIDLYSPGCPACQQIGPKVDEIAETMADKVVVVKVNLRMENNSELAKEYKIEFVPTFVFVKNGQNVDRLVGSNEELLVNTVNKHLQ